MLTWRIPDPPGPGTKVRDRDGVVWERPWDDPDFVDLWYAPGMNPMRWHRLLGERGTVTEVT